MRFPLDAPLHDLACDRQPAGSEALAFAWADGRVERFTFGDLAARSRAWADALAAAGIGAGSRVALVLPQCPLAPVLHLALSRLGAIAVPLSPLFGPDGLAPRLQGSGASLAIVHAQRAAAVAEAAPALPVLIVDGALTGPPTLPVAAAHAPLRVEGADSPPLALIYTSGTTAQPKGALLPHRVVPGRMEGFLRAHPGFAAEGDRFWSPADWAWIGGLYDSLFAPWLCGAPVFAYERSGPFDPVRAGALLLEHGVRNAFLPPTALRLWMRSGAPAPTLRTLQTAGEPLPEPVHDWAAKAFGTAPREVYGLTECAYIVVNDEALPGITGRAVPGHAIGIVRPSGAPVHKAEVGELTVRRGSPTMMLGYLRDDGIVELPLDAHGWMHTGDLATRDAHGRITLLGRADDVVKLGGYRVAPREVEAALLRHAAVEECAVVGVPDDVRGTALKAFVHAAPGVAAGPALASELQEFVRARLAAHEVPRDIVFVASLPKTTTGKLLRRELRKP